VLIAAQFFTLTLASIAGILVAVSPHLTHYSSLLTPDFIAVPPILGAVYLIARSKKKPSLPAIIGAGALLGLSCWLRSNSLLLAPLFALASLVLLESRRRWIYSAALMAAMAVVISPITIRNWIVYNRFIPLTIVTGLNLIEGIGAFDREGRFGLPVYDQDVAAKEAEWSGRPEYADSLWRPDGVERDRERFARGVQVIRENPGWFLRTVLKRAAFMVSYNDSGHKEWPFNTSQAPLLSVNPSPGHYRHEMTGDATSIWNASASDFFASGIRMSNEAEITLRDGVLQLEGDSSPYRHQFASALIPVKTNTDYLLTAEINLQQSDAAVSVTTADGRITLASTVLQPERKRAQKKKESESIVDPGAPEGERQLKPIVLPFASGPSRELRLVISNNGRPERLVLDAGEIRVFETGATPGLWTSYLRFPINRLQKNLFKTTPMRVLIILGVALLIFAKRPKALLIVLTVPAYYLITHAGFSTEYRYVLAMHYCLLIAAAVPLYCFGSAIYRGAALTLSRFRQH
jgi:hypothetical protein